MKVTEIVMAVAALTVNLVTCYLPDKAMMAGENELIRAVLEASKQPHCSPAVILLLDVASSPATLPKEVASLGSITVLGSSGRGDGAGSLNDTQQQMARLVQLARQVQLRSWCVTIVVASSDPAFLVSFAQQSRRGRFLEWSSRIVIVTRSPRVLCLKLLSSHWTFSKMNTVFLCGHGNSENTSRWQVLMHMPYTPSGPQVVRVASWTPATGLLPRTPPIFIDKFTNLHGSPFSAAAMDSSPFFLTLPSGRYAGREYIMLLAVAQALNFTVDMIPPYPLMSDCVEAVARGLAMVCAIRFMLLPHLLSLVDHLFLIERATLTFCLAKPPTKPGWQNIYYPLAPPVWAGLLALLLLLPPLLKLFAKIGGGCRGLQLAALRTIGLLLGQDALHRFHCRTSSLRALLLTWLIFAFILASSYSGNLTAFLTVRKYPSRPETLQQLADTGIPAMFPEATTWFRNYFMTSSLAAFKSVGDRSSLVHTPQDGLPYVASSRAALFYERYYLELQITKSYSAQDGSTLLYVAKENVLPNYGAWLVPHGAPYKDNFNLVLARTIEAGLKDKWMEQVVEEIKREIRKETK